MSESSELSIEEIRPLTIEALGNFLEGKSEFSTNLQITTLYHEVGRVAVQKGLRDGKGISGVEYGRVLSKKEARRLGEVINRLFSENLVMWKLDPTTSSGAPFMDITEYGEKVLRGEGTEYQEITPHDPDGFIEAFQKEAPEANDIVKKYLIECVQTYRGHYLRSSAVMLGVAAESVFIDIYSTIKKSLTDPNRIKKFEKLDTKSSLKEKFDEISNQIQDLKPLLDNTLKEIIKSHIEGIFELIRLQRNDFAHPTLKDVSRDDLFVLMRLFRSYAKTSYLLCNWLNDNYGWEVKLETKN